MYDGNPVVLRIVIEVNMKILKYALAPLVIAAVAGLAACSSGGGGGDGNPTGGGGGTIFSSGDMAGSGGTFSHTFTATGTILYHCRYHGDSGGVGMSGVIAITNPGQYDITKTVDVTITASSLPNLSIKNGDTVRWTNISGSTHTVQSDT